ncbi:NAD-dependent deacetylase sirtuin-2 [Artomyces pyxidatus]|uniref:NAD-dependent deacetylase sirtuin-2 n=1 Tax=Artomyces pyxidatus TaxID=48021 RepID=A0ACB8SMT8_9AGAM|nr:NAD-dependent deacetylase sirtuin-2 [Artomyces pyxidatus]
MDDYGMNLLESILNLRHGKQGRSSAIREPKDIPALAEYMKSDACKNVYVMMGAGVSTSAGIPDFRSPETGLYANLARLNLPYPEAVFEINFFRRNPKPFYALAKELYPGKFRPTIAHSFIKLLSDKNLLRICFTQNIDTLERRAGVSSSKIIEAHGSFANQRCIDCKRPFDDEKMKPIVQEGGIPRCERCHGLVKPDIVFFGESLPDSFSRSIPELRKADLLIIMGTSLTVHPFASLAGMVPRNCPRVLINLDQVGDLGDAEDDFLLLGKCDDIVVELAKALGWEAELRREWEMTADSIEQEVEPLKGDQVQVEPETLGTAAKQEEVVKDEVDLLTKEVEKALVIDEETTEHKETVPLPEDHSDSKERATEEESRGTVTPAQKEEHKLDLQERELVNDSKSQL